MDTPLAPPATTDTAKKTWGASLAAEFRNLPGVAQSLLNGIDADPAILITTLKHGPDENKVPLYSAFAACEEYMRWLNAETELKNAELASKDAKLISMSEQLGALSLKLSDVMTVKTVNYRRQTSDPDKFSGDEKDITKRQIEYLNWRSKVGRNIVTDDQVFDNDFKKIQYAASMLTGSCYQLFQSRFDKLTIHKNGTPADPARGIAANPTGGWPWKNADELFSELNKLYATMDLSRNASLDLERLWMKGSSYP
ncbi:hypothetical protein EDB80DRAFT_588622, partial [Ilyonectria destructans]